MLQLIELYISFLEEKCVSSLQRACAQLAESNVDIASVYPAYDSNKETVLLCLTTEKLHLPAMIEGLPVVQKPFNPESTESIEAERIVGERYEYNKELDETIAYHAEALMKKHSNLEVVKMSLVKSTKTGIKPEPCIVLLCRCKSYIPVEESEFPKILQHPKSEAVFSTDVREGYFTLCSSLPRGQRECNWELAMGCSIGPKNDQCSASLGVFVNIQRTNELCFLTVRHLFQPLDKPDSQITSEQVVQPSDGDLSMSYQGPRDRCCGTVKVAKLSSNIDAALVKIEPNTRFPKRGNFVGMTGDDLDFTGNFTILG